MSTTRRSSSLQTTARKHLSESNVDECDTKAPLTQRTSAATPRASSDEQEDPRTIAKRTVSAEVAASFAHHQTKRLIGGVFPPHEKAALHAPAQPANDGILSPFAAHPIDPGSRPKKWWRQGPYKSESCMAQDFVPPPADGYEMQNPALAPQKQLIGGTLRTARRDSEVHRRS